MAKIIIIAPAEADDDVKDAVKILKAAGHDIDTEEPTAKSILHLLLGLCTPSAYGFGGAYTIVQGGSDVPPPADDEDKGGKGGKVKDEEPEDTDTSDDAPSDDGGDDFNFESLGQVKVDGELIEAETFNSATSLLCVESIITGAKTTYSLNESMFSFWPANPAAPTQRMEVVVDKHSTSVELPIEESTKTVLKVGKDLRSMFEAMGMSDEVAAKKIFDKIKGTPNLKTSHVKDLVKQYLDMVGKAESDIAHLTALVISQLQDADLI